LPWVAQLYGRTRRLALSTEFTGADTAKAVGRGNRRAGAYPLKNGIPTSTMLRQRRVMDEKGYAAGRFRANREETATLHLERASTSSCPRRKPSSNSSYFCAGSRMRPGVRLTVPPNLSPLT
jgi:hypothetical protein